MEYTTQYAILAPWPLGEFAAREALISFIFILPSLSITYKPRKIRHPSGKGGFITSLNSMSLVSGPGRGGSANDDLPGELKLVVDKHVDYIKSLDTVSIASSWAF